MFKYQITEEIYLRILEERDAEALFHIVDQSRESLREWLSWLDRTRSVQDSREFIKSTLQRFATNAGFDTGIFYHHKLVGVIGYHAIDWNSKKVTIGYWLGTEFHGRGIMTQACKAMVDYAFNELNLNRVEIRCAVENKKSRAIPERLHFVNEGCIRQAEWLYDHYVDHIVYGMLKEEWKA